MSLTIDNALEFGKCFRFILQGGVSRSIWTPGPNFMVVFGPPLKNLDPPKARAQRVLVGQFAVFLGRLSEFVSLR